MNANEKKGLIRGAAIQAAAALAPYKTLRTNEDYKALGAKAALIGLHVVAELERLEGDATPATAVGLLDKLKAEVVPPAVPQADGGA